MEAIRIQTEGDRDRDRERERERDREIETETDRHTETEKLGHSRKNNSSQLANGCPLLKLLVPLGTQVMSEYN